MTGQTKGRGTYYLGNLSILIVSYWLDSRASAYDAIINYFHQHMF